MRLAVFSHKPCWSSVNSPSGYATDGGFPFQMNALSQLFDETRLVVPCAEPLSRAGEIALEGNNLSVAQLSPPTGRGVLRKLGLALWLFRNTPVIFRELLTADAVHAPIPGDIGTIGMLLAFVMRKPLLVRHCGNWLKPVTRAEHFWKWFMEKFAGGRNVMLATGGSPEPPSHKNSRVHWIFSTSLSQRELQAGQVREWSTHGPRLIIVCRQEDQKGTGTVIQSLPLIVKEFPNVSLDVVGDGDSLKDFRVLAQSLGVHDRTYFHGKVDHAAVGDLLRQADLFCYPTRASEGFPKVVLEALASGLPVLTTRVSVLPELIGNGGGVLLDEGTPAVVAEAVIEIFAKGDRYCAMSALAIKTAQQYSLECWVETIAAHLRPVWGDLKDPRSNSFTISNVKDLKVCFVAGTLGRGGAERQLIYMLRALKAAGIKIRVLCLTKGEPFEAEIKAMGISVKWVGASRWRPVRLFQIVRELRREPANIIQSAHFYTNIYTAIAARLLGKRSIGAIRNDVTSELRSNGTMGWSQLHLPQHLIANSALGCQRAIGERIRPERVHLVPNVVEVSERPRQSHPHKKSQIVILFAARLTEQKRPDRFIHALRKVADTRPDLDFKGILAGDGPLRPRLEQLAGTLGLSPRYVEFLGELADLKTVYRQADLLVLTSQWEGTPNVLLEAMACGLPVVASRVGGVAELVKDGVNGFLVEADDIDSIARSILTLLEDSELRERMGSEGHRAVQLKHSPSNLGESLVLVYRQVLRGAASPVHARSIQKSPTHSQLDRSNTSTPKGELV
jgi:glycosyltransferase involved in cell wall biosynthesis